MLIECYPVSILWIFIVGYSAFGIHPAPITYFHPVLAIYWLTSHMSSVPRVTSSFVQLPLTNFTPYIRSFLAHYLLLYAYPTTIGITGYQWLNWLLLLTSCWEPAALAPWSGFILSIFMFLFRAMSLEHLYSKSIVGYCRLWLILDYVILRDFRCVAVKLSAVFVIIIISYDLWYRVIMRLGISMPIGE